jgi:tetratricopeptide (TPR) repeat protein
LVPIRAVREALSWGNGTAEIALYCAGPLPRGNTHLGPFQAIAEFPNMSANRDPLTGRRLDSWKEIAAFFGRAERTVKRWEAERGLPIHRVPGIGRGSVFAYADELAEWLKGRNQELEEDSEPAENSAAPEHPPTPRSAVSAAASTPAVEPFPLSRALAWIVPVALVTALAVFLSVGHRGLSFKAVAGRHTPNPEAQELYLRGRYYWDRRTPEDLNQAIDYFTQAIVKDPTDAQPYVGLADCYNLLREFGTMPASEAYPRALAAAQRAVELDESSAEAHNSLAFVTFWWAWRGATAEREFRRALELDPNFVRAHHWYATYLLALHRYPEALDQIEQAQHLEPSSSAILADKALLLWMSGRREEGLSLLGQLEKAQPSFSSIHDYLGRIFWEQNDYPGALLEWRKMATLRHDQAGLALADAREQGFAAGGLPTMWGHELPVQKDLFQRGLGSAYDLAATCAALGRNREALSYLKIAFERREASMLTGDPTIPALDSEPEYRQLRAQVELKLAE